METNSLQNKSGLRIKFALLYTLSAAIIFFIIWVLLPKTSSANMVAARPLDDNSVQASSLLSDINALNTKYKELKRLDQEYARKVVEDAPNSELETFKNTITRTESGLLKKIDSLDAVARSYNDENASGILRSFTESFRMVASDHSSMQAFKTAVSSNSNTDEGKQALYDMQNDIQARNSRIAELESQVRTLTSAAKSTAKAEPKVPGTSNNNNNNQAALNEAQATISSQENKIASLTATIVSLEKEAKASRDALEQAKKSTDNGSTAARNQVAALEKRVSDLNTDVRLAQVDCNLARADATQIISNAKQRRALLADALNTLNTLGATGDANVKKKVAEKIVRLNQVASTMRD